MEKGPRPVLSGSSPAPKPRISEIAGGARGLEAPASQLLRSAATSGRPLHSALLLSCLLVLLLSLLASPFSPLLPTAPPPFHQDAFCAQVPRHPGRQHRVSPSLSRDKELLSPAPRRESQRFLQPLLTSWVSLKPPTPALDTRGASWRHLSPSLQFQILLADPSFLDPRGRGWAYGVAGGIRHSTLSPQHGALGRWSGAWPSHKESLSSHPLAKNSFCGVVGVAVLAFTKSSSHLATTDPRPCGPSASQWSLLSQCPHPDIEQERRQPPASRHRAPVSLEVMPRGGSSGHKARPSGLAPAEGSPAEEPAQLAG